MPQHLPYKLPEDGYYYFRPYHYSHIAIHQGFVSTWGGDQRNPYSFEVFDQLETEELPGVEPSELPHDSSPSTPGRDDARPSPPIPQSMRSRAPHEYNVGKSAKKPNVDIDQLGIVWSGDQH